MSLLKFPFWFDRVCLRHRSRVGQSVYELQEGCEILVAATDNDSLDLGNMFVHDLETDIFAEPECRGTLPETLQRSVLHLPLLQSFPKIEVLGILF